MNQRHIDQRKPPQHVPFFTTHWLNVGSSSRRIDSAIVGSEATHDGSGATDILFVTREAIGGATQGPTYIHASRVFPSSTASPSPPPSAPRLLVGLNGFFDVVHATISPNGCFVAFIARERQARDVLSDFDFISRQEVDRAAAAAAAAAAAGTNAPPPTVTMTSTPAMARLSTAVNPRQSVRPGAVDGAMSTATLEDPEGEAVTIQILGPEDGSSIASIARTVTVPSTVHGARASQTEGALSRQATLDVVPPASRDDGDGQEDGFDPVGAMAAEDARATLRRSQRMQLRKTKTTSSSDDPRLQKVADAESSSVAAEAFDDLQYTYKLYVAHVCSDGRLCRPCHVRSDAASAYLMQVPGLLTVHLLVVTRSGELLAHQVSLSRGDDVHVATAAVDIQRDFRWHQWIAAESTMVTMKLGKHRDRYIFDLFSINPERARKKEDRMTVRIRTDWIGASFMNRPWLSPPVQPQRPCNVVAQNPGMRMLHAQLDCGSTDFILCLQCWTESQSLISGVVQLGAKIYSMKTQQLLHIDIDSPLTLPNDDDGRFVVGYQLEFLIVEQMLAVYWPGQMMHFVDVSHRHIGPFSLFTVPMAFDTPLRAPLPIVDGSKVGGLLYRPGTAELLRLGVTRRGALRWLREALARGDIGPVDVPPEELHLQRGSQFAPRMRLAIIHSGKSVALSRVIHAIYAHLPEPDNPRDVALCSLTSLIKALAEKSPSSLSPQLFADALLTHCRAAVMKCGCVDARGQSHPLAFMFLPMFAYSSLGAAEVPGEWFPYEIETGEAMVMDEKETLLTQSNFAHDATLKQRITFNVSTGLFSKNRATANLPAAANVSLCDEWGDAPLGELEPCQRIAALLSRCGLPGEVLSALATAFQQHATKLIDEVCTQLVARSRGCLRGLDAVQHGLQLLGMFVPAVQRLYSSRAARILPPALFVEGLHSGEITVTADECRSASLRFTSIVRFDADWYDDAGGSVLEAEASSLFAAAVAQRALSPNLADRLAVASLFDRAAVVAFWGPPVPYPPVDKWPNLLALSAAPKGEGAAASAARRTARRSMISRLFRVSEQPSHLSHAAAATAAKDFGSYGRRHADAAGAAPDGQSPEAAVVTQLIVDILHPFVQRSVSVDASPHFKSLDTLA